MTLPRDISLTPPPERTGNAIVMTPVADNDRPINPFWRPGRRTRPTPEQEDWDRDRAKPRPEDRK